VKIDGTVVPLSSVSTVSHGVDIYIVIFNARVFMILENFGQGKAQGRPSSEMSTGEMEISFRKWGP
jgi:hypothetical protein